MKPLGFIDYVHLQIHAKATLSDRGTITEESSILNFPAPNIREAHERPKGMKEGAGMMTGLNPQRVRQGLEILRGQPKGEKRSMQMVKDCEVLFSFASEKELRSILSYTEYVRKNEWHEGF